MRGEGCTGGRRWIAFWALHNNVHVEARGTLGSGGGVCGLMADRMID